VLLLCGSCVAARSDVTACTNAHLVFAAQIDLLSRLRHPNLVMFLGACVDASQPLVLVEYCRGGSLQVLATRNSFSN
jgi:serine/threonine protein kinase